MSEARQNAPAGEAREVMVGSVRYAFGLVNGSHRWCTERGAMRVAVSGEIAALLNVIAPAPEGWRILRLILGSPVVLTVAGMLVGVWGGAVGYELAGRAGAWSVAYAIVVMAVFGTAFEYWRFRRNAAKPDP